ncbi:MAG: response regulator [Deltaproteobacteria bacterium]|nr:response regulator [Deltaproteobacteria bacterium]
MIRDIPTRGLLLLGFLVAGLAPLIAVALIGYSAGRDALAAQAFRHLESARDIKKEQLARFFDERLADVRVLARDPYLVAAFGELDAAFHSEGGAAGGLFRGQDHRRFTAPAGYRAVHDRHFGYLAGFVAEKRYYDLLLLGAASGETCFSVEKESDFAVVVAGQPTALREVWRRALVERRAVLSDTRPYPPSADAAAQFVAAPIEYGGRTAGVAALQISLEAIDAVMQARPGLGRTGETYLVGSDLRLRSDSAVDVARTVQASFRAGGLHLDTVATRQALAGAAGSATLDDPDGRRVLAAWTPLDVAGIRWALVARIDEAEVDDQIDRALDRKVAILVATSVVAVVLLALLIAAMLTRHIRAVGARIGRLSDAVSGGMLEARADGAEVPVDFRPVVARVEALAASFVAVLDSVPEPVLLVDGQGSLRFANAAAARHAGGTREALAGRPIDEVLPLAAIGEARPVRRAMAEAAIVRLEVEGRGALAGAHLLATAAPLRDAVGAVVGGIEVVVDQTELWRMSDDKRRLEERVAGMQRLEALGTLAGGIAHDFNNILTCMFACADTVTGLTPAASPAVPHLQQLDGAIERASDLVRQILAFSRQVHAATELLDLGPLVKETVKLVAEALPAGVRVELAVPDRQFTVNGNPTQLHQVLMNLLANARDALGEGGGALRVELDDEQLGASDARVQPPLPAGPYCVLRVADSGCGMDARTMSRVFEPFFTTKPMGRGTGMGLALVHGIVTAGGGGIAVTSSPGEGSTFSVFLPRSAGRPAGRQAAAEVGERARRGGLVLLAEDDAYVREVTRRQLESLGFTVRGCADGREALAAFRERPDGFVAVLTDLRMPEVDGLELADGIRALRPQVPVVLTTAYGDHVTPDDARARGVIAVLLKPYRKSDLARLLAGVPRPGA